MSDIIKKARVLLEELVNEKSLELSVIEGKDGLRNVIESVDINRPGLALAGWYKYFTPHRIQVFGLTEIEYLKNLPDHLKIEAIDDFFSYENTAIIISRNIAPPDYFIIKCRETRTPLLRTPFKASDITRKIIPVLEVKMNPRIVFHGELVEVYGVGILIIGRSGIGKSECALELVKRNHIFIADDIVEFYRNKNNELIGQGSEVIKYHLEIRGIGIINIKTLYGVGVIKDSVKLDLAIEIEDWDKNKEYDRLGLNESVKNILGVDISTLCIPVRIGRNLASIIEVAAMNYRSKKMGFYSVKEFNKRLINWIQGKENQ
ncbi:MAG TPA: HPr(Ser) kinase/phosphatase [bacterium]|nr:HPr(Ser) kinase/phosphatase [bacterium]HPN31476.1 HPr(Ser) kinase/phosphatase [bacterium]